MTNIDKYRYDDLKKKPVIAWLLWLFAGWIGAMTAQAAPATNTQTSVTAGGGCAPAPFGLWRSPRY